MSVGRHRSAGDGGGALADDRDPLDRTGAETLGDGRRKGPVTDDGTQPPVHLGDPAAQRLGEAVGRFGDLLEQEVGRIASVDVAGRDFGDGDVVGGHRRRRAVVVVASDPRQGPAGGAVEGDEFAAPFAVEAHVSIRLLDDAVWLTGDDVAVVGDADVDALPTPAKGEHHQLRPYRARCADRDRAIEAGDGSAECLDETVSISTRDGAVAGNERRDHLGVGGDRPGDSQLVGRLQIGMIVDVPVEHADDVGPGVFAPGQLELFAIDRVGVGLRDDADTRPPRVAEHGDFSGVARHRQAQEIVAGDLGAHRRGVVTEFADLGGRLVDEGEHGGRTLHRAAGAPSPLGTTDRASGRRSPRRSTGR